MKNALFEINCNSFFLDKADVIASELNSYLKDNTIEAKNVLKIECRISVSSTEDYSNCCSAFYASIDQCFNKKSPARILLAQNPIACDEKALIKISINDDKKAIVEHKVFQKHPYTLVRKDKEISIISGGITFGLDDDKLRRVQGTYDFVEQLLDHEEMHFGQMAHQWNYIQDVDSELTEPHTGWTNLQMVDEIRGLYFDPTLFKHGYPIQSHIGIDHGRFISDFIAISKDGFPAAQIKCESAKVSKGVYLPAFKEVHIGLDRELLNLKAGTKAQADELLNELLKKISSCKTDVKSLDEIIVYLANKDDFDLVRATLEERLSPMTIIYVQAKTSNKKALIDIEGVLSEVVL